MKLFWIAPFAALLAAGCTSSNHVAGTTTTSSAATSSTTASSAGATTTTAAGAQPGVPTLGATSLLETFAHAGAGFGQVKPVLVFLGGDPTGRVDQITWQSWGGAQAQGTGTSTFVAAGQTVSQGTPAPTQIVAFDLGTCDGQLEYRAVEWYFPTHGGSFDASKGMNICDPVPFELQHAASGVEFYSPSHNVNCEIDYGAPYPDKQAFCFSSTPDQSATLSVSGSFTTCSSNCQANPASNAVELPYGEAIVLGPFKCRSADAGMFCTANGKGFQISKSGITAFSE